MKKGKRHIILTWITLICFAAGQWAIFAHQHKTFASTTKTTEQRTTVSEKCQLCDAMHFSSMGLSNQNNVAAPLVAANHIYTQGQYNFISIALILAAGRAPPIAS